MPIGQGLRQSFIIMCQTGKTRRPAEAPLHHPTARQRHEAPLGGRQLDHFELDAVLGGRRGGLLARVTLIEIGDLDRLTRLGLHTPGEFSDLSAVLFIGRTHAQGEQVPQGIDGQLDFVPFTAFHPVITGTLPTFDSGL